MRTVLTVIGAVSIAGVVVATLVLMAGKNETSDRRSDERDSP